MTIYAVGKALEANPAVAEAFAKAGHEVASHACRLALVHNKSEHMNI